MDKPLKSKTMKKLFLLLFSLPLIVSAQITNKRLDYDTSKTAYNQLTIHDCHIEGDNNVIRVMYTLDLVNSKGVTLSTGQPQVYTRYGTKYDSLRASSLGQMLFGLFQLDASKVDSAKNVFRLIQTHP